MKEEYIATHGPMAVGPADPKSADPSTATQPTPPPQNPQPPAPATQKQAIEDVQTHLKGLAINKPYDSQGSGTATPKPPPTSSTAKPAPPPRSNQPRFTFPSGPVTDWNLAAQKLPREHEKNCEESPATEGVAPDRRDDTLKETFKKTKGDQGGPLSAPRKYEDAEFTVHDNMGSRVTGVDFGSGAGVADEPPSATTTTTNNQEEDGEGGEGGVGLLPEGVKQSKGDEQAEGH